MKNLKGTFVVVLLMALVSVIGINSCAKEKKVNPNAQFGGTYIGTANCDGSVTSESIPVEASSSNSSGIKIYLNSLQVLTATVNGNYISVPVQNFSYPSGENYRYSGSGTLTGNALDLTLSILYSSSSDPDYPYQCTYTLSK
jgi:hypothetical protein